MRWSPWRRNSWALSLVWSRSAPSTGPAAASRRSSPAAAASSARRGPEHEAALQVAGDEAVVLEGDGEPVGGRAGQAGRGDELGEGRRPGLEGAEDDGCLVENADSTGVVHGSILPSHSLRRKSVGVSARANLGVAQRGAPTDDAREQDAAGDGGVGDVSGTLAEKVWDAHVVRRAEGEPDLLYIDLHLDPRGHPPAGLRRPAARRPHRPPARPHPRHRGPQRPDDARPDHRPGRAGPRSTRCAATARSSASGCSRWATPSRASSTSSARSSA